MTVYELMRKDERVTVLLVNKAGRIENCAPHSRYFSDELGALIFLIREGLISIRKTQYKRKVLRYTISRR